MWKTLYALVFFIFCFSVPSTEGAVLDRAIGLYTAGKYDSTIILIRDYLRKYGKEPQTEQLVPLVN